MRQGVGTVDYPSGPAIMPEGFRGAPAVDRSRCADGCSDCANACPTVAIELTHNGAAIDHGKCLFCTDCVEACATGAITHSTDHRMAARRREDLVVQEKVKLADALDKKARRLFGRSLSLRQVSAGGCNGCEAEINTLNSILFDLSRFGVHLAASPRHADGLIITGPVTQNMVGALEKAYDAIPTPKIVIAVGACAISGGIFADHPQQSNGADRVVPVDLYIPGCPPHPVTILDGLLHLLGRIENEKDSGVH